VVDLPLYDRLLAERDSIPNIEQRDLRVNHLLLVWDGESQAHSMEEGCLGDKFGSRRADLATLLTGWAIFLWIHSTGRLS
jgi:hypothetical protein